MTFKSFKEYFIRFISLTEWAKSPHVSKWGVLIPYLIGYHISHVSQLKTVIMLKKNTFLLQCSNTNQNISWWKCVWLKSKSRTIGYQLKYIWILLKVFFPKYIEILKTWTWAAIVCSNFSLWPAGWNWGWPYLGQTEKFYISNIHI